MGVEADPLPWSDSMPRLVGTGGLWWVEWGRLHGVINLLTNPGLGQGAVARDQMPGLLSTD